MADKGYDSRANHLALDHHGITPIILMRRYKSSKSWYSPNGTPLCCGSPMKFIATHPGNGHHLFRCLIAGCGRKLYVNPDDNLRIIGRIARADRKWSRFYSLRQTIERMFGSLKHSRLLTSYRLLGKRKIEAHVALAFMTYMATILAHLQCGSRRMRHMRV